MDAHDSLTPKLKREALLRLFALRRNLDVTTDLLKKHKRHAAELKKECRRVEAQVAQLMRDEGVFIEALLLRTPDADVSYTAVVFDLQHDGSINIEARETPWIRNTRR